jgi:hypothetical protein
MIRSVAGFALLILLMVAAAVGPVGAQQPAASSAAALPPDVLAAETAGEVEVRLVANDSRSAQILITNRSGRPLTLRLPAAFAGVPILAQMQQGAGFGAGGIGAQPQGVGGGGMGGMGGGMGGGMMGGGMGGNPFCWVAREVYGVHDPRWLAFRDWMTWQAPEWLQNLYATHGEACAHWLRERPAAKAALRLVMDRAVAGSPVARDGHAHLRVSPPIDRANAPFTVPVGKTLAVRASTVCLDHGLREPTPRMPYRLVALDTVSEDPRLPLILGALANGHLTQKVAQAAAWHISSGRSWEQLAGELIKRAGGDPDLPFFSAAELAAAQRAVAIATRLAGERPAPETAAETASR